MSQAVFIDAPYHTDKEPFATLVLGTTFREAVSAIGGSDVDLYMEGDDLILDSVGLRYAVRREFPTSEWITFPWKGQSTTFPADVKAIKSVVKAAAEEQARPALYAVCFEPDGEIVAADGYRLLRYIGWPTGLEMNLLIGRDTLTLAGQVHADKVAIRLDGQRQRITITGPLKGWAGAEITVYAPVVNERYPDWREIWPSQKIAYDRGASGIDVAAFYAGALAYSKAYESGAILFAGGEIKLFSSSKKGPRLEASVPAEIHGVPFLLGTNWQFLSEALSALKVAGYERVRVTCRAASPYLHPYLVQPDAVTEGDMQGLIMPVNVAEVPWIQEHVKTLGDVEWSGTGR